MKKSLVKPKLFWSLQFLSFIFPTWTGNKRARWDKATFTLA